MYSIVQTKQQSTKKSRKPTHMC